jgi:hydrogenase/urease accessory protein HupE
MIGANRVDWAQINKLIRVIFLFSFPQICHAHAPGLSSADLIIHPQGLDATITFALQDIEAFVPMDSNQDAEVTDSEREAAKPEIAKWIGRELRIKFDGQDSQPAAPGTVSFDKQNNVHVEFHFLGTPAKQLSMQSNFLSKLLNGHKQYVTIKDSSHNELEEKMLTQQDYQITVILNSSGMGATQAVTTSPENSQNSTFFDFLILGIEHILTGYDHLLFLFSLLVVTRSFWPAIKIITFFTIAHSITLALAGFNVMDIPSNIVEPLIAATIIYVGIENLIRGDHPLGRGLLTFFFGLIHGFGFAGVLREMGISSYETGILVPLFSFNLGVELGQITVASIILPLIWCLHTKPQVGQYLSPVCSVFASLAGSYWLVERTWLS